MGKLFATVRPTEKVRETDMSQTNISIKIHDNRKDTVSQINERKVLIPLQSIVVRLHPIEQTPTSHIS